MKSKSHRIVCVLLTLLLTSCATVTYTPRVTLDVSTVTIPGSLRIDKLLDVSPPEDMSNPFGGFSVSNNKALIGDLGLELTNSILYDFQTNGVFEKVSKFDQNADYVLSGEIRRFMGRSKLTTYGVISLLSVVGIYTWYFGMPVRRNETNIQIVFTLKDRQGNLIGTYTGMFVDVNKANIYHNIALALPSLTNKALGVSVGQVRSQIIRDLKKY